MKQSTLVFAKRLAEGNTVPITDTVTAMIQELNVMGFPVRIAGDVARIPHTLRPLAERLIYEVTEPEEQHSIGWGG